MKKRIVWKGLVLGIIVLFVGIAVQPGIIADDVIESDNSEMVEITIQICKGNGAYDHNVKLSKVKAEELESLISRTKTKLDAAETLGETSAIFNDTVVSLYELGMLPEDMSIEEAKRLVNGMDQNPRIVKILERRYSRNQEKRETFENFLCLIAGYTDETSFIGPSIIPLIILVLIIGAPLVLLEILFDTDIGTIFPIDLYDLFFGFGFLNLLTWQFIPLAFGHLILLGGRSGIWFPLYIPAEGWINTIGLKGIMNWNSFYGGVLGFTGIKICYPPRDIRTHFYMGAALTVDDKW